MLDYRKTGDNTGNIYFTTGSSSIKAKNIQRGNKVFSSKRLCKRDGIDILTITKKGIEEESINL